MLLCMALCTKAAVVMAHGILLHAPIDLHKAVVKQTGCMPLKAL